MSLFFALIPVLFWVLCFGQRVIHEVDIAKRQVVTDGTITDCQFIKSGQYCHYMFSIDGRAQIGGAVAPRSVLFGDFVNVYYDPENPSVNSLEDFVHQSHTDETIVYAVLLVVVGCGVYLFLRKSKNIQQGS